MNNSKISVIVPIYNVEQYLDKCIESIINQTYTNLEIILVDDGSPDNCPAMCDNWAKKDKRIIVIHQDNKGGGAARNAALDVATGEIIAFVDSDDYISENMFEHLYKLIESGADIAECNYVMVNDDNICFENAESEITLYSPKDAMLEHIQNKLFRQVIWNKLYKKNTINNIRFPINTKIDDEFFTYQVIGNANTLIHSDKICYAYRQQNTSIMHTINTEHYLQAIFAKDMRHKYICIYFPELINSSLINLWFTAIYIGQITLKESLNNVQNIESPAKSK